MCLGEVFCYGWSGGSVLNVAEARWNLKGSFTSEMKGGWLWKIFSKFVYFSKLTWALVWKRINFSRQNGRVGNNSVKKQWGTLPKLGLYFISLVEGRSREIINSKPDWQQKLNPQCFVVCHCEGLPSLPNSHTLWRVSESIFKGWRLPTLLTGLCNCQIFSLLITPQLNEKKLLPTRY